MINLYAGIMVGSQLIAAISQMLLKKSATKKYKNWIYEYLNPYVVTGYILLIGTMFINIVAYSGIEYKVGAVLATTSYIFVMIVGRICFNEKITVKKFMGNVIIICGIIIFNWK